MFKYRAEAMTLRKEFIITLTGLVLASAMLSSCASSNAQYEDANGHIIYDPLEESNRRVFALNEGIDDAIINPVVRGYQFVVPEPARDGVDNALRNLRSPTIFVNELLQGDIKGAGKVVLRAIINTIIGVGGLFDVAGYEGIEHEYEDFGQTLAVWGVDHGPYLVVPVIGPSSARDYAGFFVDSFTDPLRWYLFNTNREGLYYGKTGAEYLALRESLIDVLEDLEKSSIDYYAATRSAYYQHREALVNDQDSEPGTSADIPEYDDF